MKPRILISANQKSENYINAIEACGGTAFFKYLPNLSTDYDGLLLCGGNDIFPLHYGQELNGALDFDKERDIAELELTKAFIDTGKPILGICRGMQLLNVALGGTLIQDLPLSHLHRSHNGIDSVHSLRASGILSQLYGTEFNVNSAHHQALNAIGRGLIITATSGDVIEAVEHKAKPYLGVQFHPERMCLKNRRLDTVDGIEIFKYFIELCKQG